MTNSCPFENRMVDSIRCKKIALNGSKQMGDSSNNRRKKIDMEMKLNIIKKFEEGQRISYIARDYGLSISTVSTIAKQANRIKEHMKGSVPLKSTVITKQRAGAIDEMEHLLIKWIRDKIEKRELLSLQIVQAKAKSIYSNVKRKYPAASPVFLASNGWFSRFKSRAGFHCINICNDTNNGDVKASSQFIEILKMNIIGGGYTPQQVFNVCETELYWKKIPNRAYFSKQEKTIPGFKTLNYKISLLLGNNASGDCKLKPLLVHHSENTSAFKGINKSSLPVHFYCNENTWITATIFENWFSNYFIVESERYCKENNIAFNILLILDNSPSHPLHLDHIHPNVKILFLPMNTASMIQPMNQGIISNFKLNYIQIVFAHALSFINKNIGSSIEDFWKSYNLYQGILRIERAWEEIGQSCLNSSWRKVCYEFTNKIDEVNENHEEILEEIRHLAEQLKIEISTNYIEEFTELQRNEISNENIQSEKSNCIEFVETDFSSVKHDETQYFDIKEMILGFHEISTGLSRFEKMDPDNSRFEDIKNSINSLLSCYKEIYEVKVRVDDFNFSHDPINIKGSIDEEFSE